MENMCLRYGERGKKSIFIKNEQRALSDGFACLTGFFVFKKSLKYPPKLFL